MFDYFNTFVLFKTVGSLGVVEEIDDDDDFKVKVDQFSWIFSPVCCQYVEEESLTDPERAEIQQIKPELKKKKATPPPSPQSSEEGKLPFSLIHRFSASFYSLILCL